jgi:cytochrome c peroxidase
VYRPLFEQVWGVDFDINWPSNVEQTCSTPEGAFPTATPVALSATDRTKANNIYDHWGQSISFLESSNDISPFTSKVDARAAGTYTATPTEAAAIALFGGKADCNSCHLDGLSSTRNGGTDTGTPVDTQPLFTCFGYSNLGLPLNPRDSIFYQSRPDAFGFTPNSDGMRYRDLGFGTFLRSGPGSAPNPNATNWLSFAPVTDGQMLVSTVRDVAMTPPQCPTTEAGQVDANGKPIPYFQKEFFHNGYAKSQKQFVHFYNTRDVFAFNVTSGHCPPGTTEKVDCWPMPEVRNNIDMTVGNLGLTDAEENLLVIALQFTTDGFDPANPTAPPGSLYKNIDTYTGQCTMTKPGVTALTQGNETLIPTWRLAQFPCATDVCNVQPLPTMPIP